jgi:hypothetical protein
MEMYKANPKGRLLMPVLAGSWGRAQNLRVQSTKRLDR